MKKGRNPAPAAPKASSGAPNESFENKDAKEITKMTKFPASLDLSTLDQI